MKLRLLLALPALLLASLLSHAQVFEPGLLVRSNGDTLRGEIENAFWVEPPTSIRFRATADASSQTFLPRQLRAVSFTNGRYFRYEILPIDHAAETRRGQLPLANVANIKIDSLLVEVLVEGPATLFRAVLPGAPHYLIRRTGQPVLDISPRLYMTAEAHSYVDANNYKGQLVVYFGDCAAAATTAQSAPFTPEGIVAVVQAFNKACSATRQPGHVWLEDAKLRRRVALQGGITAGARYNHLDSSYPSPTCIDCQTHPFAGLYGELLLPSRTTAFYGELSSSTFRSQGLQLASFTYVPFVYRAWLHTARLGVRFYFALPHENQWLVGLNYELNAVSNPSGVPSGTSPNILLNQESTYGNTGIIPNLNLGWRNRRITLVLDGQFYRTPDSKIFGTTYKNHFSTRLGLAYRLGRNPDAKRTAAVPK